MAAPFTSYLLSLAKTVKSVSCRSVQMIINDFINKGPPPSLAVVTNTSLLPHIPENRKCQIPNDLNSIFGGVLLAVQRARRTAEKRLKRKHGFTGHFEHAMPKRNIIPCLECGNFREKGHLCQHCYEKVKRETKLMQEKAGEDLSFQVPNKDVMYVYDGETVPQEGKFVVEMEKPRPSWFPRKLLNKTG